MVSDQIPLPLGVPGRKTLAGYFPGGNAEVLAMLAKLATSPSPAMAYLHGVGDSGKSHLLQAAAAAAREAGMLSAYLPLGDPSIRHGFLGQLNSQALLCLDDIDQVAGNDDFERGLLALYERCRGQARIVFAAAQPPAGCGFALADLVSRLSAQPVYRLAPLDDVQRQQALVFEARRRGLEIAPATVEYLMRRVPRGTAALFALLDRIDRASLEENRRVTIPFLRRLGVG